MSRRRRSILLIALPLLTILAGFTVLVAQAHHLPHARGTIERTRAMLHDDDVVTQQQALHFLAEWGPDDRLRADIERAATSPDADVRFGAARVLCRFRDDRAVEVLTPMTRDPDPEVAETAIRGLDAIQRARSNP